MAALAPNLVAGPAPKKANQAPFAVVWSPEAGNTFTAPASIALAAGANDPDGWVRSVKYYEGSTLIGTATNAPYTVWWENVPAGLHTVIAVATDNVGAQGYSDPVTIRVRPNPPPTVHIDAPNNGASFIEPESITIAADADDRDGGVIRSVTFFVDGLAIGTSFREPYTFRWRSPAVGPHVLTAVATDNGGLTATSAPVNITVKQNAPPSVRLTSPADGASFTQPVNIRLTADASDSDGIKNVAFFVDSNLIGTAWEEPYRVTWHHASVGTHTLTAVATDERGKRSTSAPVTVTVKENVAPTVAITSPTNGQSFVEGDPIAITADASDTDGGKVKLVTFFADGMPIGIQFTAPYIVTWRGAALGAHSLKAIAIDNGGLSTTSAIVTITVKSKTPPDQTPVGQNVTVTLPLATVTFANVTKGGTTTASSIAPPDPAQLPARFTIDAALSFDVSTTAEFTGGVTVCFNASSFTGDAAAFAQLRVLHGEGGVFVDRTILAPGAPAPDFATHTICAAVSSLSPFVIGHTEEAPTPDKAPLVQPNNIVYQGAFRLPSGVNPGPNATEWELTNGLATFNFGGWAMAFNPAHDSLFLTGNNQGAMVAEVGIPVPVVSSNLASLNVATYVQPFSDPTEAKVDEINPGSTNSKKIGGLLPYQGQLYVTGYDYYDGLETQIVSHFVANPDLSVVGDVRGAYEVSVPDCDRSDPTKTQNCLGAGFFDGYFGLVPLEWQTAFGGPVINGNCCLGVISRTSYGPALFTIDPTQLGVTIPLPAKPLLFYPAAHPLMEPGLVPCLDVNACKPIVDGWSLNSTLFNGTSEIKGVAFPSGWRSVLFFGRHGGLGGAPTVPGLGDFCYGPGTEDGALAGTPFIDPDSGTPTGDNYCYDPEDSSKGVHGYPYHYYVWAYDANHLAAVAAGTRQPWDVRPYAVWELNGLPFAPTGVTRASMAFDQQSGRIFVAQYQTDVIDGNTVLSVVHVFKVQ